ncbi:ABC transporter permease [Paenibacillus sp. CAU 1782]
MKLGDQLRFVRQNMKRNKTRLFMTILATAMGCAFLIVLASVGFGVQKSIVDRIIGDRLVTSIQVPYKDFNVSENGDIHKEDIEFFHSIPKVKAVTYRFWVSQSMGIKANGSDIGNDRMYMVDFDSEQQSGVALSAGRWPEKDNEIVIGYDVLGSEDKAVSKASDWLNQAVKLQVDYYEGVELATKELDAVIVGVWGEPRREWLLDKAVYSSEGLIQQIEAITGTRGGEIVYFGQTPDAESLKKALSEIPKAGEPRQYSEVNVIADNASHVKEISDVLREKNYSVYSVADEVAQINVFFLILKIGLIFVGAIAVLIASIGIFNTMTMAVTERAQDIGIMKAIGAHPSVIKRIFLLESAMIGIIGAVFGTIVAYGISVAVNAGLPVLVTIGMGETLPEGFQFSIIPAYLALLSCFISLAVAMLSGYRPAKRATAIDVLSALRRDI